VKAVLILGSNLGNRRFYIESGIKLIDKFAGKVIKRTRIIETSPWGFEKQPSFLNAGILIESYHPPFELLKVLKWCEKRLGRKKGRRWGIRTFDADIVLVENLRIRTKTLTVPHPGLKNREFFRELVEELTTSS
jgi:2-amino-4-hydroxy-6-hydroxymethyldihydropteridine diphosphokinase